MLHWCNMAHTIVIIGGGFAGIKTAIDMRSKKRSGKIPSDTRIILISDKEYFEYYPSMYRVATGSSPLVACVPLRDIFPSDEIEIIQDKIVSLNLTERTATGQQGTVYQADSLVLALGSQNNYFNIPQLDEISFNFRSVHQAVHLKNRIDDLFKKHAHAEIDEQLLALHFIVVGGGASGVELAGELSVYAQCVAKKYKIAQSLVTIDLVESGPRVLGMFSETVSKKVEARLRKLGVHVLPNRSLVRGDSWTVFLNDMTLGAKTIIWTAGVKTNDLVQNLPDVEYSKKKRLVVNQYLELPKYPNVYALGDIADTPYAGLAQTALVDGSFVTDVICKRIAGKTPRWYHPKQPFHDVPVGPGWGVFVAFGIPLFGRAAWWMRHVIDIRFFVSILPIKYVVGMFRAARKKH